MVTPTPTRTCCTTVLIAVKLPLADLEAEGHGQLGQSPLPVLGPYPARDVVVTDMAST